MASMKTISFKAFKKEFKPVPNYNRGDIGCGGFMLGAVGTDEAVVLDAVAKEPNKVWTVIGEKIVSGYRCLADGYIYTDIPHDGDVTVTGLP
jgi:hypothetical protein